MCLSISAFVLPLEATTYLPTHPPTHPLTHAPSDHRSCLPTPTPPPPTPSMHRVDLREGRVRQRRRRGRNDIPSLRFGWVGGWVGLRGGGGIGEGRTCPAAVEGGRGEGGAGGGGGGGGGLVAAAPPSNCWSGRAAAASWHEQEGGGKQRKKEEEEEEARDGDAPHALVRRLWGLCRGGGGGARGEEGGGRTEHECVVGKGGEGRSRRRPAPRSQFRVEFRACCGALPTPPTPSLLLPWPRHPRSHLPHIAGVLRGAAGGCGTWLKAVGRAPECPSMHRSSHHRAPWSKRAPTHATLHAHVPHPPGNVPRMNAHHPLSLSVHAGSRPVHPTGLYRHPSPHPPFMHTHTPQPNHTNTHSTRRQPWRPPSSPAAKKRRWPPRRAGKNGSKP